jgi:hypothetical protein
VGADGCGGGADRNCLRDEGLGTGTRCTKTTKIFCPHSTRTALNTSSLAAMRLYMQTLNPTYGPVPLSLQVRAALFLWILLLAPWLVFTLLATGMACDGGCPANWWVYILPFWTYPVFVTAAFLGRRKGAPFLLCPLLYVVPFSLVMLQAVRPYK